MIAEFSQFIARWREQLLQKTGSPPGADAEESVFNRLALELFALQFRHNAAYRQFCNARGVTPDTVRHWTVIPAIPTSAFKELDLTCLPSGQRANVFHSSGTTEHRPSRHFHSQQSLALYSESAWEWFRLHLAPDIEPGSSSFRLLILTPSPSSAPNSSLVHMFETIRRKFAAPASAFAGMVSADRSWNLDIRSVLSSLGHGERPLIVLGTAFSFVHLGDHLAEQGLRFKLPAGSRAMETGGYKGRSRSLGKTELHSLIVERLGISPSRIVCEYGMSELSSQAYDRTVGDGAGAGRFQFPRWTRALIISPETGCEVADGETGLIRIFDLANIYSVLAIQTEDLAVRRGNGFEFVGRNLSAEPRGCSLMMEMDLIRREA